MNWSNYLKIPNFLRISGKDVENVLLNLKLRKGSKVLDVGAAYGRISIFMRDMGYEVVPLDRDANMVKFLKEKGFDAVLMDARHMRFKNNSFDLIITDGLLEHFKNTKDIEKTIREEIRLSRKLVVNFVPSNIFINSILEKVQRVPKEYRQHDWIALHKKAMNKKKYKIRKIKLKRLEAYIIRK